MDARVQHCIYTQKTIYIYTHTHRGFCGLALHSFPEWHETLRPSSSRLLVDPCQKVVGVRPHGRRDQLAETGTTLPLMLIGFWINTSNSLLASLL